MKHGDQEEESIVVVGVYWNCLIPLLNLDPVQNFSGILENRTQNGRVLNLSSPCLETQPEQPMPGESLPLLSHHDAMTTVVQVYIRYASV